MEADAETLIKEELFGKAWSRVVEGATEDELRILAGRDGKASMSELILPLYNQLRGMGHAVPRVVITGTPSGPGLREELLGLCDEALRQGNDSAKIGPDLL